MRRDLREVSENNPARRVVALALLAMAAAACLGDDAGAVDPGQVDRPAPGATTTPAVDWVDPNNGVDLGDGWTVAACEGDGPFLCVERHNEPVGAIEAISFPLESFEALDVDADRTTNLELFARGFHDDLSADRAEGCGADYGFERLGPDRIQLGGENGVFFGFAGWLPSGERSELNLQYATIVDDQIMLITAVAYEDGGCPGRDDLSTWDSESLSAFRTRLTRLLAASPLPEL